MRRGDGGYDFLWFQGGGMVRAVPTGAAAAERPAYEVDAAALEEYAGVYPLMDGFDLTVTTRDGKLLIQGTGQSELPLDAVAEDVFVSSRVGVEIEFERDDTGEVVALTLRQGGNTLRGERRGAAP